jgi:hypothetical protein
MVNIGAEILAEMLQERYDLDRWEDSIQIDLEGIYPDF